MDGAFARTAALYPGRHAPSPGWLYGWGKVGGKGGKALPVAVGAVDKAGDCIYPARCQLPKSVGAVFLKASVDVGPMCALDCSGGVWVWSGWGDRWPATPTLLLEACVDCAAGSGFVVAAKADGTVWLLGKPPAPTPLPDTGGNAGDWVELPWSNGQEPQAAALDACGGVVLVASVEGALYSCGRGIALGLAEEKGVAALTLVPGLPPVGAFSVGSIHAACAGRDGSLYTWGDGLSGTLGIGKRLKVALLPTLVALNPGTAATGDAVAATGAAASTCAEAVPGTAGGLALAPEHAVIHVSCTRGQARPKRESRGTKCVSGQEGPRCHAVTADGGLWIAGTVHKGLGADHLSKTLGTIGSDHLSFYRVGGRAQPTHKGVVLTGAAEDLKTDSQLAASRMGMRRAADFGRDGDTHYLDDVRITSSCPSHIHSVALAADGRAFAWGCGSDGRTGLAALMRGPRGAKRTLKCYVSTPSVIEALEGHTVLHVTSGRYWSLAVVEPTTRSEQAQTSISTTELHMEPEPMCSC